jgi:hypothetical protein
VEPSFPMDDLFGGLTSVESRGDLSMLLLTLMTATRGFALSGCWTTSSSNLLVIRARCVAEVAEDRRGATLFVLRLRRDERRDDAGQWAGCWLVQGVTCPTCAEEIKSGRHGDDGWGG